LEALFAPVTATPTAGGSPPPLEASAVPALTHLQPALSKSDRMEEADALEALLAPYMAKEAEGPSGGGAQKELPGPANLSRPAGKGVGVSEAISALGAAEKLPPPSEEVSEGELDHLLAGRATSEILHLQKGSPTPEREPPQDTGPQAPAQAFSDPKPDPTPQLRLFSRQGGHALSRSSGLVTYTVLCLHVELALSVQVALGFAHAHVHGWGTGNSCFLYTIQSRKISLCERYSSTWSTTERYLFDPRRMLGVHTEQHLRKNTLGG